MAENLPDAGSIQFARKIRARNGVYIDRHTMTFHILISKALFVLPVCALWASLQARELIPLNGEWKLSLDGGSPRAVVVPHCWNIEDASFGSKGKASEGKSVNSTLYKRRCGVYTRSLPSPKPGKRYFLRGEGASIVAETIVNGRSAGRHEGAFTAFCHEITDLLRAKGGNTLSIKVDNKHRDHIAPQRGDFSVYGGLYRPVALIETDSACIDPLFYASSGVFVAVKDLTTKKAALEVRVRLNAAHADKGKVEVSVLAEDGKQAAAAERAVELAEGSSEIAIPLEIDNPRLWQGRADPFLYRVAVTLRTESGAEDAVTQPLGLRRARVDPRKGFVLNGKFMQLRGVSRHQDREGKGWAVSPQDEEQDMRLIADMGATALRTGHYPSSEYLYRLCDEAGIVAWAEVPNVNMVRDTQEFRENNRRQALEMIYQLWNHPSICMWGLFNEIGHQAEKDNAGIDMEAELASLNTLVKETDPSRFTVGASNQPSRQKLSGIPDHIAFNTYPGWYGGGAEAMKGNLAGFIRSNTAKGVAVSEYGHGAGVRMHQFPVKRPQPKDFFHPEEYQAAAHEVNYRCIAERPEVWASFVWCMFDFGSVERHEGERPGINDKGLVTYDRRTLKDAYYFYQANWSGAPMVYITSRRFTRRSLSPVDVKVYSNAPEVALTVNGKSLGAVKPDEQKRAVWKGVRLRPGKNRIVAAIQADGRTLKDTCEWILSPAGNTPDTWIDPSVKKYK